MTTMMMSSDCKKRYEEILQNRTGDRMPKLRIFEFPQKQKGESHFYSRSKPHIFKFEKGDI